MWSDRWPADTHPSELPGRLLFFMDAPATDDIAIGGVARRFIGRAEANTGETTVVCVPATILGFGRARLRHLSGARHGLL
jgi:hypothetical protein